MLTIWMIIDLVCIRKTYFVIFYVKFWSQQIWDQRRYIPFWKTVRQICSKYWFPQDLSFIQISRKYSKLCFPQFLFNIPCSVRRIFSKYWFPQILRDWKKKHRTWIFFKVNSQNFIHCTDPVFRPGLKPWVKRGATYSNIRTEKDFLSQLLPLIKTATYFSFCTKESFLSFQKCNNVPNKSFL